MIRLFLLLFFFCLPLFALDANMARANKWLGQKNTKSALKAYHEYKNIRINAIMQDDLKLRLKAIRGIIKSGKLLHVNIEKYRKEFVKLGGKSTKSLLKPQKKSSKNTSINYLKSARWRSGTIVLSFESSLQENQVNYFLLDKKFSKNYRYIFDISAKSNKHISLDRKGLSAIRLNASNPKRVRLVLESATPIALKYSRRSRELIIQLGKNKPKTYYTRPRNQSNTSKKVVVIDAGHGGRDGGAVGYKKYREKIVVFQISKRLKRELEDMGYKVYMTRDSDKYIKLRNRTAFANYKKADLFISVHANSVARKKGYQKHHGVETYYLSSTSSKRAKNVAATENSKDIQTMNYFAKESFLGLLNSQKIVASNKLAIDVQRGMLGVLRKSYSFIRDAGVKKGPFWVLVGAQMPAILVEVGFLTSPKEARYLVNQKYQQRLALGMALGVKNYFSNNP